MDKLASTRFRATYASLTEPVEVTVNGHAIGTWLPSPYSAMEFRADVPKTHVPGWVDEMALQMLEREPSFNTRPFTPVPKKP